MEKAQKHLNDWINDVSNEQNEKETKEYSEREVVDMLEGYKVKFYSSFYCDNMEEEGMLQCGQQCDFCKDKNQ